MSKSKLIQRTPIRLLDLAGEIVTIHCATGVGLPKPSVAELKREIERQHPRRPPLRAISILSANDEVLDDEQELPLGAFGMSDTGFEQDGRETEEDGTTDKEDEDKYLRVVFDMGASIPGPLGAAHAAVMADGINSVWPQAT